MRLLLGCLRHSKSCRLEEGKLARGGQDSLSLWCAAIWSLVITAALAIPYFAVEIHEFWNAAPGEAAGSLMSEQPNETVEQKSVSVLRAVMAMPIVIVGVALALFISVLAPVFLLARIIRRFVLLLSPPR